MRFTILLVALLPLVLGAKELLGEELPSKEGPDEVADDKDDAMMVKRSIGNIATRRRSALDKNFMRFGRSDPSIEKTERSTRAKEDFMRFGRARSSNLMRFGRSPSNFMRFGRGTNNLMRFGRANLMRFGRANNLMRFGRGGNNLMRFGRANLMRFGRSGDVDDDLDDPEDQDDLNDRLASYLNDRIYEDEKKGDDSFMRFGRITTDNPLEEDQFDLIFPEDRPMGEERSS